MLREERHLPQLTQPGLVTPEGTLVFPGVSPHELPAEGEQLAHSPSWKTRGAGALHRRGAFHLPTLSPKRYLGHNFLPSAHVIQTFPFPRMPPPILSSREAVPPWGLSLLDCPHLATVPWQRAEPRPHLHPKFLRSLSFNWLLATH